MKVIGLVTVRNEAWVLPHTLACLTGFADVVLVCDQHSDDPSRDVCRRFPQVVLIDPPPDAAGDSFQRLPQMARWRLLDAARDYTGHNLLWISDADELMPPRLVRHWLEREGSRLAPATVLQCLFYNLWNTTATYRDDWTLYRPHRKAMAFVDDRRTDYARAAGVRPLHEPRLPVESPVAIVNSDTIPVLHLQWLLALRNQMKQAWYRCLELLDGRATAAEINARYSITLPAPFTRTTPVPRAWVEDVTFPDLAIDREPGWHEREILGWFDRHGAELFEALEIWHIRTLRDEFRRRVGRRPRPDRSDARPWPLRARDLGRRAASAAWRRIFA